MYYTTKFNVIMPDLTEHNLLSNTSKQDCIQKLKKLSVPKFGKIPTASAAVLVPLCVVNGAVSLLYTIRSTQLRTHSGQTSFPGGKTDEGESAVDTALREAREEIGLNKTAIDIWGTGPAIPGKDNLILITPVVASLKLKLDDLKLNEEVHKVFTVPLSSLCDTKNQFHTQFANGFILPVFLHEQYRVWGVTAYITHLFLTCLLPRTLYKNDWLKNRIPTQF